MTSLEPSLPCRSHLIGCSVTKLASFFTEHVKVGLAPTSTFTCSGVTVSPFQYHEYLLGILFKFYLFLEVIGIPMLS
jgi:uncharacterized membrane protein